MSRTEKFKDRFGEWLFEYLKKVFYEEVEWKHVKLFGKNSDTIDMMDLGITEMRDFGMIIKEGGKEYTLVVELDEGFNGFNVNDWSLYPGRELYEKGEY